MICREGKEKSKIKNRILFAAVLLAFVLVCGGGSYVYAKYFAQSASEGIAIASGVYFTANYAVEVDEDSEEYFESAVRYTSGNLDIPFEVRNYENLLLFNESTVAIPYSVSFWVEELPSGATYRVTGDGETEDLSTTKITFQDQIIDGGSALANKYIISISSGETHKTVPIFVEVQTAEGSMVKKTLRGKIVLSASGSSNVFLEQEFKIPDVEEETLTAFTYEIRTVGDLATGDITQQLKLSWNPELLEIDLFDDAFLAWQSSVKEATGVAPSAPYTENNNYYIIMDIMPYSSQTITFFRGSEYTNVLGTVESLKATKPPVEDGETFIIWAEKYQAD